MIVMLLVTDREPNVPLKLYMSWNERGCPVSKVDK